MLSAVKVSSLTTPVAPIPCRDLKPLDGGLDEGIEGRPHAGDRVEIAGDDQAADATPAPPST